jgi:hypothetical protein
MAPFGQVSLRFVGSYCGRCKVVYTAVAPPKVERIVINPAFPG